MVNLEMLQKKIDHAGIPITTLAAKCGMTRNTLYNKMAGKSELKASEMLLLSLALHLNRRERDAIFFGD